MIERTPTWLKLLLAKYGEEQGPLIGLAEDISEDFDSESVDPGELSNLLEQMAESPTPIPTERASTSVEWGQPDAPEDSIDDLLASFDVSPDAYNQSTYEQETSSDEEDVPDWLSEAIDTPPTITEMPGSEVSIEPATTPASTTEEDIPDWLSEALDAPPTTEQEPKPSPLPTEETQLGWLKETTSQVPQSEEPVETTTETDDFESPDWLMEDVSSVDAALPTSSAVSPETPDWNVPDWIAEDLDSATDEDIARPASQETTTVSGADIPDWLDSSTETELPEAPDWLMAADELPASSAPVDEPPISPETASPIESNWLEDLDDSSPQVAETLSLSTPEPTAGPSDQGWLSDLRATIPAEESSLQETDELFEDENLDIPAWLTGDEPTSIADVEPKQSDVADESATEIPDWLIDLPDAEDEAGVIAEETETLEQEGEFPDWLSESPQTPDTDGVELAEQGEPEAPAWLMGEVEPASVGDKQESPLPAWLTDISETEEASTEISGTSTEEMGSPAWLADLRQTDSDDEAIEAEAPERPDWLSDLGQTEIATETDEPLDLGTPDWLSDLSQADLETTPEEKISEPETTDWLTDLSPVDTGEAEIAEPTAAADLATPDGLSKPPEEAQEDSTISTEAEDIEMPSWLSDLRQDDEPTPTSEIDTELDGPDWLTDADQPETEMTIAAGSEEPDWLNELSSPPSGVNLPEDVAEVAETEEAAPDWLIEEAAAELTITEQPISVEPEEEVEETAVAEMAEGEVAVETPAQPEKADAPPAAEEEMEAPSWLASLRQAETQITEITSTDTVSDETDELPAWLADLPEVSDTDETLVEQTRLPAEVESPEWLTKKTDDITAGEETFVTPAEIEDETETEIPSWLTGLPDVEEEATTAEQAIAESDVETPAWLTDLRQADTEAAAVAPTDESAEAKGPDWLSELPQTPSTGELETTEAESGMPDWLTETMEEPQETSLTATEVQETASGLVELSEIEEDTAFSMEPVASIEAEDVEAPDWLTELPQAPSTGQLKSETPPETEPESPDWLSELPPAPDTGTLAAAKSEPETVETLFQTEGDDETETPDWLAGLSETDEPAATTPEPSTVEPEAPSWLTGLRQAEAETTLDAEAIDLETPDWEVPSEMESEEVEAITEESEAPDWLSELPQAADTGELAATEEVAEPEEFETPDWLTAEPAEAIVSADETVEAPDWLTELPQAPDTGQLKSETLPEAEPESPDWLRELSPVPDRGELEVPPEPEPETPDWLGGTGQSAEVEIEAEDETPAWLTEELTEMPATETTGPLPVATDETIDLDTPAWLDELSDAGDETDGVTKDTSAVEAVVEEAPGTPDWLTGLRQAEPVPEDEALEVETLGWLDELTEEADTVPETVTADEAAGIVIEEETPLPFVETAAEAEFEAPDWLAELSDEAATETIAETDTATIIEPEASAELLEADLEAEPGLPDWLAEETPEMAIDKIAPASETTGEAALPLPDWLDETTATEQLTEIETIEPAAAETDASVELDEEKLPPPPDWMSGLREATEAVKASLPSEQAENVDILTTAEGAVEEPPALSDDDQIPAPASFPEAQLDFDAPVETPDWLKDLDEIAQEPVVEGKTEDEDLFTLPSTTTPLPAETKKVAEPSTSGWLQALKPSERKADIAAEDNEAVESTGVLTGLAPLLPAEKLETPVAALPITSLTGSQFDGVLVAARQFYTIATQAPQPATLPEPLTQPKQLIGNLPRLGVFLLFIALIVLPLLPGLRATDSDRGATWTEPVGELSETLDRQRRQLISEPLGIIDQQQPESTALVSFDFTTATQGEMQPLAEAIIGRLKGQGMRLIFVSLEPEGAALAQQTIDKLLAERNETYGDSVVNLGYIPGQVAGIRNLVTGQTALAALKDFKEALALASAERANWHDIKNLGQVDLVVTMADNPATARWWVEQMEIAPQPDDGKRFLLAAASAAAEPLLRPYQANHQLDGLITGINGAAAIEAGRREFGLARQMLDSQSIAHLFIVIVIVAGTIAGWMPPLHAEEPTAQDTQPETAQTGEGG